MKAWKDANPGRRVRGSKGNDGTLEARAEEDK
jgi:hypothetical protein